MGLTLSRGWKMAALVTISGGVLLGLNARALRETVGPRTLLSTATAAFVVLLGLRLLLDTHENDG